MPVSSLSLVLGSRHELDPRLPASTLSTVVSLARVSLPMWGMSLLRLRLDLTMRTSSGSSDSSSSSSSSSSLPMYKQILLMGLRKTRDHARGRSREVDAEAMQLAKAPRQVYPVRNLTRKKTSHLPLRLCDLKRRDRSAGRACFVIKSSMKLSISGGFSMKSRVKLGSDK